MEQYIPKNTLIAEIENIKSIEFNEGTPSDNYACMALDMVIETLDTLEVKEVKEPANVFIEKAEKYLKNQFIKDVSVLAGGAVHINFSTAIENFLNYMKGE